MYTFLSECVHVSLLKEDMWITAARVYVTCHCAYSSIMCSSFPCSASFLPASCVAGCHTSADLHCKLHSKQIALKDILEWRQSPLLSQEGCPDVSDKAMRLTRPCSKSHFDILGNTQVCTQKKIDLGVFSLA